MFELLVKTDGQRAKPFPWPGYPDAGWVAADENALHKLSTDPDSRTIVVIGVGRYYLVKDHRKTRWEDHSYLRLDLRDKTLKFTVDLSRVQCRCLSTLYLSFMPEPSNGNDNYCGINAANNSAMDGGVCTELDIMEANTKAFQTTVHTHHGRQPDGSCNQNGCVVNYGNNSGSRASGANMANLYGSAAGAMIDTKLPFAVTTTFDASGIMSTKIVQGPHTISFFDSASASNPQGANPPLGIPTGAMRRTAQAHSLGLVLVISQWGGFDTLDRWFNGVCSGPLYTPCDWDSRKATVMRISDLSCHPTASTAETDMQDDSQKRVGYLLVGGIAAAFVMIVLCVQHFACSSGLSRKLMFHRHDPLGALPLCRDVELEAENELGKTSGTS
eukprot:CAMPEP_0119344658 /NCGR_PEP_ID=MMETSP1333-20130426/107083_1 /TAXON_ID=418940 /ORGANISM="Scyphosphaera apsteinii, Strain RCC1455" /LENGTH=385 /DNA_ID=CAMNT_0007357099 /DNA_START=55 /DNA_END=1212 /DNA_ORIENTATION=+